MAEYRRGPQSISKQALQRMPLYLNYLRAQNGHKQSISAPAIAADLGLNEVQVRKDLAAVSSQAGKPKRGFDVAMLMRDIERFLGYDDVNRAVLAGAGHLGGALLSYRGFAAYGLEIVAAFDNREELMGKTIGGTQVFPIQKAPDLCKRLNAHIGIITVPTAHAQEVCDKLVEGGVLAIWNFASAHLTVPKGILVHHENMAASLAALSQHLREQMKKDRGTE